MHFYAALLILFLGNASLLAASTQASPGHLSTDGLFNQFIGDTQYNTNVFTLDQTAGNQGKPSTAPWSGSYWPLHSGGTADPYAEGGIPWLNTKTRILLGTGASQKHFENRMAKIRGSQGALDETTIDEMAPTEKYDLYIGDPDYTLTYAVWESVDEELIRNSHIALWAGSCQGWATAAIYAPRPSNAIRVLSLDGKYMIPFYPDDLKALSTLLWANSLIQDHATLLGSLCSTKSPLYDRDNGKVLNAACAGVNAGDFHVAVLEMVGNRKESFVVNRTNNTQVWNQPVSAYELNYFNPYTHQSGSLSQSIAPLTYHDPLFKYRPEKTKNLVGVSIKLHYASERSPTHQKRDGEGDDHIKTLKLEYDLEIDEQNQILGGEWRDSDNSEDEDDATIPKYPGFIWKFSGKPPIAASVGDNIGGDSDSIAGIPQSQIISISKRSAMFRYNHYRYDERGFIMKDPDGVLLVSRSELRPQPFSKVVNQLVRLSRNMN